MRDEGAMNHEKCFAQEWQRDGRGLWAMRRCRYFYQHVGKHDFDSWRYNVQPPNRECRRRPAMSER
jgi:hypothetical protein